MKESIAKGLLSLFKIFKKDKISYDDSWKDQESIFQFIERHINTKSNCLEDSTMTLPDDVKLFKPGEIHFVAGGLDGVYSHHLYDDKSNEKLANTISKLLVSIAKTGSEKSKNKLYKILENDSLINLIDSAFEKALDAGISAEPFLHDFSKLLSTRSPDRGPVKFGISLLGIIGHRDDLELIQTLGKHEEFTLFSSAAIIWMLESADWQLFQLAQCVDGWGKINIVEKLAETKNTEIQKWLVRSGYQNSIMYEYLAYTCAVAGDLHKELAVASIDKELFDGAGEIIEALINGGVAEDIEDYEYASEAILGYLKHFSSFSRELKHFIILHAIKNYLNELDLASTNSQNGWNTDSHSKALDTIEKLLDSEEWSSMVKEGLSSHDDSIFYYANRAATSLNINTWDVHWKRLQESPTDSGRWYPIMAQADRENIDSILKLASKELPLLQIASGPADELGLGPEYEVHSCLDAILQELHDYPGKGKDLILAGLSSPVVRNRHMALNALEAWSNEMKDQEIIQSLKSAFSIEPDEDLKKRIQLISSPKN